MKDRNDKRPYMKNNNNAGRLPQRGQRFPSRHDSDAIDGPVYLFGIHAVEAALQNSSRQILELKMTENAEQRLTEALASRGLKASRVQPRELDNLLGPDAVHQGACIKVEPLEEPTLEELVEQATSGRVIIVLDQVTDPHNVGAIMRSAAAFGAAGLVMTRRHSPPLTGVLAKSASGALEHVPVALVTNLAQALAKLADLGVNRIGLDGESDAGIEGVDGSGPTALVLGAEGKGLRRLTRELCDQLCRISTTGSLQSLNVSNAAAIALHSLAIGRKA